MQKMGIALVFLILAATNALSLTITGEGCSPDKNKALKFALADLSSKIYVTVKSELTIKSDAKMVDDQISQIIYIETTLPLIGYESKKNGDCILTSLNSSKVIDLYLKEIKNKLNEINILYDNIKNVDSDRDKLELYKILTKNYIEYEKLALVAHFMGAESEKPSITKSEIETQLAKLKNTSSDISQIALNLKEQLKYNEFKVSLIKNNSGIITPFGVFLTAELAKNTTANNNVSLNCSYSPSSEIFTVNCQINDKDGNILDTAFTGVNAKVCESIDCTGSINKVVTDRIISSGISGHFYSNFGLTEQYLTQGDILRVYLRLNSEADFILIHRYEDINNVLSVNGKYINSLPHSKINTEILLITLNISPPFGEESLVILAAKSISNEFKEEINNGIISDELISKIKSNNKYFESSLFFITKEGN